MTTGSELYLKEGWKESVRCPRERKRMMMLDDIKDGITYDKLKEKPLDREEWEKTYHERPVLRKIYDDDSMAHICSSISQRVVWLGSQQLHRVI